MKLYYITRVQIPSGAAQSVQISSMCEAFNKENISFKLISTLNEKNLKEKKSFSWEKIKLNTKFRYLEFVLKSLKYVYKGKPTHIYTRDIVVAYIFSFFNIKIVYEAHKEPRTKTANIIIKRLRKKDNFLLITISKALKNFYLKDYNYSNEKVFDYHDAVFIDKYDEIRKIQKSEIRKELSLPINKTIVMHTGSLYPGRGAEHFETIIKKFPNILFVQVGGTKEDIEKYKSQYKIYSNIIFIEHQNNEILIKYQISSDLLFYPMTKNTATYWCCSPMKIFEYMATGVPILSSNVGSVSEVLNNKNSIPFNPDIEETIIDGINDFLKNNNELKEKTTTALNDVREKYTWEKRVKEIIKFLGDR